MTLFLTHDRAPDSVESEKILEKLCASVKKHYDKRADTLKKNSHPLGVQVNLGSGVANGVLVVRGLDQCISLIYNIVMNRMEFELEEKDVEGRKYLLLKEKISDSVFRVVTGDDFLTNTFWNFYL